MVEFVLGGQPVQGMPLAWTRGRALLLRRDGQILNFSPANATQLRKSAETFRALKSVDMRTPLLREFGPAFDVQFAGKFVVVHPKARNEPWAQQFDQLHRNFVHYYTSRGVGVAKTRFPLVAIVFPDRLGFLKYAAQEKAKLPPHCIGYYSNFTNRVVLYDQGASTRGVINSSLIIHEASHQVAFNVGIHHRGSPPPRWLSEGLGTMFEAPGVWNSQAHPNREDRINMSQLAAFRRYAPGRPAGSLASFVSNEWLFRTDVAAAYGESWALSFFLSETHPHAWANFLRITGNPKRDAQVDDAQLLQEFMSAFGADLRGLEAQYLRFMEQL